MSLFHPTPEDYALAQGHAEARIATLEGALAQQRTVNAEQRALLIEQETKISRHADEIATLRAFAGELSRAHAEEIVRLKAEHADEQEGCP